LSGNIVCIPINKKYNQDAKNLCAYILKQNIVATVDTTAKSLNKKIYTHLKKGKEVLLFVGQREIESNSVNMRIKDKIIGLISINDIIENLKLYAKNL
ncbi:MAG: His/Gly/Thr/Pro-type tRNA ligase C-terminal domain-containing protein, partial [Candidatus Dojkabacteria bacterium]|nr:His/Gly/Thr/Pro-type tRNA ligase C-terminal domain-containing protein [Candidatus Dojkabacteria bacterium]